MFIEWKSKILVCLCIFYKNLGSKIRTILFTNHFDLGWKENSLKIDWDLVELSGKTAMISTKPRPPQNYLILLESIFFLYYRWNVQGKWAFCGFGSQLALLWPLNLSFAFIRIYLTRAWRRPVKSPKKNLSKHRQFYPHCFFYLYVLRCTCVPLESKIFTVFRTYCFR